MLIWASGKDQIGSELHTNFRIDQTGEAVILTSRDGKLLLITFMFLLLKWTSPMAGSRMVEKML